MVAMLCKSVVDWLKYEGHGTMVWTDNDGGVKLETIIPWLMIPTNLNSAGLCFVSVICPKKAQISEFQG